MSDQALDDPARSLAEHLVDLELLALQQPTMPALATEVRALRSEIARYETDRHALYGELATRDEEVRGLREALGLARRRSAEAASLYIATHRLHATLDRAQVLQALEEILASLIGCEEMVVFELLGETPILVPVATTGLPPSSVTAIRPPAGVVAQVLASGRVWTQEGTKHELFGRPITACVPLSVDGEITGAIVLFRLLTHKAALEPADLELLEVLSVHAGTALYVTRVRRRSLGAAP
jgi:hypothetical protein